MPASRPRHPDIFREMSGCARRRFGGSISTAPIREGRTRSKRHLSGQCCGCKSFILLDFGPTRRGCRTSGQMPDKQKNVRRTVKASTARTNQTDKDTPLRGVRFVRSVWPFGPGTVSSAAKKERKMTIDDVRRARPTARRADAPPRRPCPRARDPPGSLAALSGHVSTASADLLDGAQRSRYAHFTVAG